MQRISCQDWGFGGTRAISLSLPIIHCTRTAKQLWLLPVTYLSLKWLSDLFSFTSFADSSLRRSWAWTRDWSVESPGL